MKLFEFMTESDYPPAAFPKPGAETFSDRSEWMYAMKEHGAEEFLKEKEFNLDLIYAVGSKGSRLKGTWSDNKQMGVKYPGKKGLGLAFEKGYGKSKRTFYKAVM